MLVACLVQITKTSTANDELRRVFYHWVIRKLVDNIEEYRHGFEYLCPDGIVRWIVPVFALGITDWPEGQKMCLIGAGAKFSKTNCRFCMHPTEKMGETQLGETYGRRRQQAIMHLAHEARALSLTNRRALQVLLICLRGGCVAYLLACLLAR